MMILKFIFLFFTYSFLKDLPRDPKNESVSQIKMIPTDLDKDMIYLLASEKARSIVQDSGEDMRPLYEGTGLFEEENVTMDRIKEIHIKNKWLDYLNSSENTEEDKLLFIKRDMENDYKPFNIFAGGLMLDW